MSQQDNELQELEAMAQLPPNDPTRQVLLARLAEMDPKHREHWLGVLRETDQIYAEMGKVPVPADLADRLLTIPDTKPTRPALLRPTFLLAIAAALLLGLGGSLAIYLMNAPHPPAPLQPMQEAMAMQIANEAVALHVSQENVQLSLADADKLRAELESHAMPFPVVVLQPRTAMDLAGGGVCDFHGVPAVYTRWKTDDSTYTVYEIDQKTLGAPARFQTTTEASPTLWRGDHHYRVVIWPGAKDCTWAVVLDGDNAKDAFSSMPY